jgi:serine/threonine protein kinase
MDFDDEKSFEEVKNGRLGESTAKIVKVRHRKTNKIYVRKQYMLSADLVVRGNQYEKLHKEVEFMKMVTDMEDKRTTEHDSPFRTAFPSYVGSYEAQAQEEHGDTSRDTFNIILLPIAEGSLDRLLRQISAEYDPKEPKAAEPTRGRQEMFRYVSLRWIRSLAWSLAVLHQVNGTNLRHRDLKPENILVYRRKKVLTTLGQDLNEQYGELWDAGGGFDMDVAAMDLLITDFGISKSCHTHGDGANNNSPEKGMMLPPEVPRDNQPRLIHGDRTDTKFPEKGMFSAPEVFRGNDYRDKSSDVFSLGCLMFEILAIMWNIPGLVGLTYTRNPTKSYAFKTELMDVGSGQTLIDIFLQSLSSEQSPWHQGLGDKAKRELANRLALIGRMTSDRRDIDSERFDPARRGVQSSCGRPSADEAYRKLAYSIAEEVGISWDPSDYPELMRRGPSLHELQPDRPSNLR